MKAGRYKFMKNVKVIQLIILVLNSAPKWLSLVVISPLLGGKGWVGLLFRYIHGALVFKKIGDVVYIGNNCVLKNAGELSVGNNFSLHEFSYIDAIGGVIIGDNVSIAHSSSILSSNHQWNDLSKPIKYNHVIKMQVVIEDDVWIGCGVRILAGSHIEKRVVVAAGAVVTGRLESGFVYGGIPAKKLKAL